MKSLSIVFLMLFAACGTDPGLPGEVGPAAMIVEGEACVPLVVKEVLPVGQVCLTVNKDSLRITYATEERWRLEGAQAWAGFNLEEVPVNRAGVPMIDRFPVIGVPGGPADRLAFDLPLEALGLDPGEDVCEPRDVYFLVHANVFRALPTGRLQRMEAWGQGERLQEHGAPALFFRRTLTCDRNPEPVPWCASAFARGSQGPACFLDAPILSDQWGWTNGPLLPGTHRLELYADALHCDFAPERRVGTLEVEFDGKTSRVVFKAEGGLVFEKTHLYVGSEPLPRDPEGKPSVNPGDYPFAHAPAAGAVDEYRLTGHDGRVHVAAHAVVCKPPRPGN